MKPSDLTLPDAELLLDKLAAQLKTIVRPDNALVGIHSGGVWIMERLLPTLGPELAQGKLDVSFYRDDFSQRGLHSEPKPSEIAFEVEGKHIILIDDVFYTGRTIRAAMNELFDYGRPASISLAVLINRGGRELPITPQITAHDMTLPAEQNLQLMRHEDGRFYLTLEDKTEENN